MFWGSGDVVNGHTYYGGAMFLIDNQEYLVRGFRAECLRNSSCHYASVLSGARADDAEV